MVSLNVSAYRLLESVEHGTTDELRKISDCHADEDIRFGDVNKIKVLSGVHE